MTTQCTILFIFNIYYDYPDVNRLGVIRCSR